MSDVTLERIPLSNLNLSVALSGRPEGADDELVAEYVEKIEQNENAPPIATFYDGTIYWVADGAHRALAAQKAAHKDIEARVRPGGEAEALLYMYGANSCHGKKRDRLHIVALALRDPQFHGKPDREIARACRVPPSYVERSRVQKRPVFERICTNGTDAQNDTDHQVRPEIERICTIGTDARAQTGQDGQDGQDLPVEVFGRKAVTVSRSGTTYEMTVKVKAQPDAAPTVDSVGLSLKDKKVEVFKSRPLFEEAKSLFRKLATIIDKIASGPGGEALKQYLQLTSKGDTEKYRSDHLAKSRNEVTFAEPYAAKCPYCFKDGFVDKKCKACRGQDWVTKSTWELAPEDLRQAVEAKEMPSF